MNDPEVAVSADCTCTNEWHDHNRTACDALFLNRYGQGRACGKPTTWLAPPDHPAFPLAYCPEHQPRG